MEWDEEVLPAARDGVITVRELVEIGVPSSTVVHRCRGDGPWQRLLPGVVLLRRGAVGPAQRVRAALAYGGGRSRLTGLHAAAAHGLRRVPPDEHVHVLVPATAQRTSSGFALLERTSRLPCGPVPPGRVPIAPVERAVLDAARRLPDRRVVCQLLADAVQSRRTTPQRLRAELEAGSGRGSALVRRVLREDLSVGVHSVAEADARQLVRRSGLPEPCWNPVLRGADGRLLGYPDAWFDDVALAWQIDSYAWHLSPRDYAATLDRDAALVAEGVVVVRSLPSTLRARPARTVDRLARAYRQARLRPRPPVTAVPRTG